MGFPILVRYRLYIESGPWKLHISDPLCCEASSPATSQHRKAIDDLFVQVCGISSVLALEIPQSCTKPLKQSRKNSYECFWPCCYVIRILFPSRCGARHNFLLRHWRWKFGWRWSWEERWPFKSYKHALMHQNRYWCCRNQIYTGPVLAYYGLLAGRMQ